MKFDFSFNDIERLSRITDRVSLSEEIFCCTGRSTITFGSAVLEDTSEILLRISELVAALDALVSSKCLKEQELYFEFQFERRIIFKIENHKILVIDRETRSSLVEKLTLDDVQYALAELEKFITIHIFPRSEFAGMCLLNREIL